MRTVNEEGGDKPRRSFGRIQGVFLVRGDSRLRFEHRFERVVVTRIAHHYFHSILLPFVEKHLDAVDAPDAPGRDGDTLNKLLLEFVGRLAPAPTPGAIARNLPPLVAEGDLDGAPCLRAFIFELSRPCGVFGPVLFWAFRLSAAFCSA